MTPIYDFTDGSDGGRPEAGVIRDPAAETAGIVPAGTLFGTTPSYGKHRGGTLFMLTPPATSGAAWTLTVLHSFNGRSGSTDGSYPLGDLIADPQAICTEQLYLVAIRRALMIPAMVAAPCSELSPPDAIGGEWTYRVLHRFRSAAGPSGKLTLDPSGNGVLYGSTSQGGDPTCGCGGVFSLTPPGVDGNTASGWAVSWLHAFRGGIYGAYPGGSLVFDNASPPDLFGVAGAGASNDGMVFELLPPNSAGNPLPHWSERLIHSFKGRRPTVALQTG